MARWKAKLCYRSAGCLPRLYCLESLPWSLIFIRLVSSCGKSTHLLCSLTMAIEMTTLWSLLKRFVIRLWSQQKSVLKIIYVILGCLFFRFLINLDREYPSFLFKIRVERTWKWCDLWKANGFTLSPRGLDFAGRSRITGLPWYLSNLWISHDILFFCIRDCEGTRLLWNYPSEKIKKHQSTQKFFLQ